MAPAHPSKPPKLTVERALWDEGADVVVGVDEVGRDRYMRAEEPHFPGYDFELKKGYPCPRHKMALQAWGPTSIHRRTWVFMDHTPWGGRMPHPLQALQPSLFE